MESMPCHNTPASSLPEWLRLEASPTGLWADRQGLAIGSRPDKFFARPIAQRPRPGVLAGAAVVQPTVEGGRLVGA
jgi:hypothetical protein